MQRVLVFDVNETLLDVGELDPLFANAFGAAGVRTEWFFRLLHASVVANATDAYTDFGTLAGALLDATATAHSIALDAATRDEILGTIRRLPAHPDVADGLDRLGAAGFRMAALTNSAPAMAQAQLANAAIIDRFETVLSVGSVERFKPAPEPYLHAADRLGIDIADMRMIAAHDWDCAGALRAGAGAAFIARAGCAYAEHYPRPDVVGSDLIEVADLLIADE